MPVISPNLRDISTPFGFVETKKRDAVLWKQDSFYPVPCFQVRFKRWRDCATLPSPKSANLLSLLTRGLWVGLQGFEQLQTYEQEPSSPVYEWIKHYRVYGQLLLQQDNQRKVKMQRNIVFSTEVKYCGLKWVGEGGFTSALRVLRACWARWLGSWNKESQARLAHPPLPLPHIVPTSKRGN